MIKQSKIQLIKSDPFKNDIKLSFTQIELVGTKHSSHEFSCTQTQMAQTKFTVLFLIFFTQLKHNQIKPSTEKTYYLSDFKCLLSYINPIPPSIYLLVAAA